MRLLTLLLLTLITKLLDEFLGVLSWWGEHGRSFSNIAHISRFILAIPAPSAASLLRCCICYSGVEESTPTLTVDDV